MEKINCNDYHIIKICYYADKLTSRKHDDKILNDPKVKKQHWQRAKDYTEFKWNFIEHITKKDQKYWYTTYRFDTDNCAFEEINEVFGIICEVCQEGWYYYFIPKEKKDIIEWMKEKLVNPYKIIKKCKYTPYKTDSSSQIRDNSLLMSIDFNKRTSIYDSIK